MQVLEHKPPKFPYTGLFASISGFLEEKLMEAQFLFATFFFLANAYSLLFDNFRFWGKNIFVWTLSKGLACLLNGIESSRS